MGEEKKEEGEESGTQGELEGCHWKPAGAREWARAERRGLFLSFRSWPIALGMGPGFWKPSRVLVSCLYLLCLAPM